MPKKRRPHKRRPYLVCCRKGAKRELRKLCRSIEELQKLLAESEISKKQP